MNPQDLPTTTTTTTTTTTPRYRSPVKRNRDGVFTGSSNSPVANTGKNPIPNTYPYAKPIIKYPKQNYDDYYYGYHQSHENHTCIFETLAKKNNMSTGEYLRMVRSNLSKSEGKPNSSVACLTPLSLMMLCCFVVSVYIHQCIYIYTSLCSLLSVAALIVFSYFSQI